MPHKIIFGLYGAGGFAREVMPLALECWAAIAQDTTSSDQQVYFMETTPQKEAVNGISLISEKSFFEMSCKERYFNIAIGESKARERLAYTCIDKGAKPMTLRAGNSTIYDNNEIGEGAIICAYSVISANVKIGKFFHSYFHSYVGHDCVIGDFVTFAPNVSCHGNIHIHNHAYIGAGSLLKQGTSDKPLVIGEGAVVGMGAVVTKDVPPYTTVVGNPAKPLLRKKGD